MKETRLIFVCGNDGSGKSTYMNQLYLRYSETNREIDLRHYYDNPLRKIARYFIKPSINKTDSKVKLDNSNIKDKNFLKYFYMVYVITIILLIRVEVFFRRNSIIIYDRSFIDEMVSIEVVNKVRIRKKWYLMMFRLVGDSRFFFLDASSEQKFNRIIDKDISKELFLEKEKVYKEIFKELTDTFTEKIKKIYTNENK